MDDLSTEPLETPVRVYVEVSDTVSIDYTTGIQRVVREIVTGLASQEHPDIEVVPVFKASPSTPFRRLTGPEIARLEEHPAGGVAGRRADSFGVLAPLVRLVGDTRLVYRIRIASRHVRARLRERRAHGEELDVTAFEPGSVFLDLEGSWFDPEPREALLPRLTADGVIVMTMVHDVMPILFPQWFAGRQVEAFSSWVDAHLENSSGFITNSICTARDLQKVADERGIAPAGPIVPIALGADFPHDTPSEVDLPAEMERFLLVVGTLEPRKNHELVLDAWETLAREYTGLGLVMVGKEGWMVEELVQRIRSHDQFGRTLVWLGGIDDAELVWLYRNAFITVVPSLYEGLGVPVMEALHNRSPVISSTGGALPEAGAGLTELVEPDDLEGLVRLLRLHLEDPDHHRQSVEKVRSYQQPTWEDATAQTAAVVRSVVRNARAGRRPPTEATRHDD